MTWEDYQAAQAFLEKKSLGLMEHEGKAMAKTGFPFQNYRIYPIAGRIFYTAGSNTFNHIMESVLLEAVLKYPALFGTANAFDVVEALRLIWPTFDNTERHAQFLQEDHFCLVMESKEGVIQDKVLRIDLFRSIKNDAQGKPEFVGGIFHAFKHFSYNSINLSTGKDINDIASPDRIIGLAIKAFFLSENTEKTAKGFNSRIELNEHYNLLFSFYHEPVNDVYFINTIFKEPK